MDSERTTSHVLEGRELIDYLIEKTSTTANAELLQREELRNRRMTVLMTLIGAIGIGGVIGALKFFVNEEVERVQSGMIIIRSEIESYVDEKAEYFRGEIESHIAEAVRSQVEVQVGQVRAELEQYKKYQELIEQAETITSELAANKVPYQTLDAAILNIETLAQAESIRGLTHYLDAVNVVIDLLVRSDRNSEIDRIEKVLHDKLVTHKNIALNLTDHYGQVIISSPYPVDELPHEFTALTRYAQALREMNYPEKALLWELFVAFKSSHYARTPTTDVMTEMVQDLNKADLGSFCYHIFKNSHPLHWEHRPDQEGRELARLVNAILENYPTLKATVESQIALPNIRPSIEQMVAKKDARLKKIQSISGKDVIPETASTPANDNMLRR